MGGGAGDCLGGCQGYEDMLGEIPAALSCLTICRRCQVITNVCTAGLPQRAQQTRHSMHSGAAAACTAGQSKHAQQAVHSMHSRTVKALLSASSVAQMVCLKTAPTPHPTAGHRAGKGGWEGGGHGAEGGGDLTCHTLEGNTHLSCS